MTIKDWIYLGITISSYLLAIIAGVYAKDKAKINRATRAGKALDVLGKLATNAVQEAEYLGGTGPEKREFASAIINQGLVCFGIKNVTPNQVNGALEAAVNAMNIANQDFNPDEPEIAENVSENEILQPADTAKGVTKNDK